MNATVSAEVRVATEADRAAVFDTIVLAFSADPMARWALADATTYLAVMPKMVRAFGGHGLPLGASHLVDDGIGAAMWLPPGVAPDAETLQALLTAHAPKERLADMMQVFEEMDHHHPTTPCWYLPLLGVDPSYHGRGCGSALLRHALAKVDEDAMPAYLESSNPRNIPLYQRHGFEAIGSIQVGTSPTLVPMLRPARG
jgi:ribosomal protein S18 acetylase RimI-like enzyme